MKRYTTIFIYNPINNEGKFCYDILFSTFLKVRKHMVQIGVVCEDQRGFKDEPLFPKRIEKWFQLKENV